MNLPDMPSELIRLALADLREAEKSPHYVVDMASWHQPTVGARCLVCLAGAVMAFSLGTNFDYDVSPRHFPPDTGFKLNAINDLRTGYASAAFSALGLEVEDSNRFDREIVPYRADREAFHREMEALASDLAKAGY